MTDRPILFSGRMVLAILAGIKTQTRRLVTPSTSEIGSLPQSAWPALRFDAPGVYVDLGRADNPFCPRAGEQYLHVPHEDGETVHRVYPRIHVGSRLWGRETWCGDENGYRYRADSPKADLGAGSWRPSIFMPRDACRLVLAVEDVRVERLQSITEEDARAEGVKLDAGCPCESDAEDPGPRHVPLCRFSREDWPGETPLGVDDPHRMAYAALWDSINGKRAPWSSNPWVWAVQFSRVTS